MAITVWKKWEIQIHGVYPQKFLVLEETWQYSTCFADPVHVSVHLPFQFLFLLEQKESGSTLHAIFLFGELSRQRVQQQKVDNRMMER